MSDVIDLSEIQKAFEDANQDDTPIAVSTPSGSQVIGDPVKQGITQPKDYEMVFYLPIVNGKAPQGAEIVLDGKAYVQRVKAKEKFISQRIGRKVRSYASTIAMAFTKFREDGTSEVFTSADLMEVYMLFDDDVIDACEKMIVTVLGVSEDLIQYITDESLMHTCSELIKNNPAFFQVD